MQIFTVSSPNTCGLVIDGANIVYIDTVGTKIYAPDTATFAEYLTQDDAASAALSIDPSFDVNQILGPLDLNPVNVGDPKVSAYAGDSLTLNCEYSCGDCDVVYEWLNPGGLPIPSATGSSLTLSNLTETLNGVYTCNASAQNEKGQTGIVSNRFKVTVYPTISPVANEQS